MDPRPLFEPSDAVLVEDHRTGAGTDPLSAATPAGHRYLAGDRVFPPETFAAGSLLAAVVDLLTACTGAQVHR